MVTHTSSVPASHCAQAAPSVSFIFEIMVLKKDHFVPAWRTEQLISLGSYFWSGALQKDVCVSLGKAPSCGVSASNKRLLFP